MYDPRSVLLGRLSVVREVSYHNALRYTHYCTDTHYIGVCFVAGVLHYCRPNCFQSSPIRYVEDGNSRCYRCCRDELYVLLYGERIYGCDGDTCTIHCAGMGCTIYCLRNQNREDRSNYYYLSRPCVDWL